jgi:hypothetical protein
MDGHRNKQCFKKRKGTNMHLTKDDDDIAIIHFLKLAMHYNLHFFLREL